MASHREKIRPLPGAQARERPAVERLFSSKVGPAAAKKKSGKKQDIAPIEFPRELATLSDVFAAGKSVLKEIEFKVKFAEQRIRSFCDESYIRLFAALKRKPPSLDYRSGHSSLKFVQTHRTTLTHDKVEELRELGVPIDDYTNLVGIDINMTAIRHHKLEDKLQEGLESLGVSPGVIEECFTPRHELNPSFYDAFYTIVQEVVGKGKDPTDRMIEIYHILNPSSQLRNVETKLDQEDAFKLINETEIEAENPEAA
jgi:hypothetical protein